MPSILPFRVEYATEKRVCKKCRASIPIFAIQMAIIQQSTADDCLESLWYCKCCFFKIRRPIYEDVIDGFYNLRYNHQIEIRQYLEQKNVDLPLEKQIKEQNEDFFAIWDKLKILKPVDYVTILKEQNQFVPENNGTEILNHLADIICFGALPPCPVCNDGQLILRNSIYCCTGYFSPWSKCVYEIKEPERVPVNLPARYKEKLEINCNARIRILRDGVALNDEDFVRYSKQPLFDMKFMIGRGKRKNDIVNQIQKMGGIITRTIHTDRYETRLAAVISSAQEVNRAVDDDIRQALRMGTPVVSEDFLEDVVNCDDPIELILQKDMNKGEKSPYEMRNIAANFNIMRINDAPKVDKWKKINDIMDPDNIYSDMNWKYNAILVFVDIISNKNSYIKLQLLKAEDGIIKYTVVESKGRIGTSISSTSQQTYVSVQSAQKEFKRIFMEKTGNEFGYVNFVKKPGKYYLVKTHTEIPKRSKQESTGLTELDQPIYELMKLLFDGNKLDKALMSFFLDFDSMSLTKITHQQVQDAIDLLGEISSLLGENDIQNQFLTASNQFYSYFPHDFGHKRPPIINTFEMIQEEMNCLQSILDKEYHFDLLTSALNEEKNLFDLCYDFLQKFTIITMPNKEMEMYTEICKYIENTQQIAGSFKVQEIFELTRPEEVLHYQPHEQSFNRQLLFHGSSITNFPSILMNGLKIAPPDAYFHGSVFGKGIYFSDSISKSARYCSPINKIGLVLLCEVAVGDCDIREWGNNGKLMANCDSAQAIGLYYPHPIHVQPNGLRIPNGKLVRRPKDTEIIYNEFVVFDESRVKIRYLAKIKFTDKYQF